MAQQTKPVLTVTTLIDGNEIVMKKYEDGAVSFSSDGAEHFIYLHTAQVEVLNAFLGAKF